MSRFFGKRCSGIIDWPDPDRNEKRLVLMQRKYGLDMRLPPGKLPGYYAQIVKGIAERASLFDRHKELLIFDVPDALPAILDFLQHYKVEAEACDLLLLPSHGVIRGDRFDDFGIETREGNVFLDMSYVSGFLLKKTRPDGEPAPALMQLEEHRIADVTENGQTWHFVESQLTELAERVARAYGCAVEWPDPAAQ
jgi:hypothetical protein